MIKTAFQVVELTLDTEDNVIDREPSPIHIQHTKMQLKLSRAS